MLGMNRMSKMDRLQRIRKQKLTCEKVKAEVNLLKAALADNEARELIEVQISRCDYPNISARKK